MAVLQLDNSENQDKPPADKVPGLNREEFCAAFPGLDPWFERRWTLPKVEPRGKSFRRRYSWAMRIGTGTRSEEGGIAWWELAVLNVLADCSGDGKSVNNWSHRRLAVWIGCSTRSVKRWLDGLRARGWVEWCHNQHRGRDGVIRQLANSYIMLIPDWVQAKMDAGAETKPRRPGRSPQTSVGESRGGVLAGRAGGLPPRRQVEQVRPKVPDVDELGLPDPDTWFTDTDGARKGIEAARERLRHPPP